jgi:hypothetical protein
LQRDETEQASPTRAQRRSQLCGLTFGTRFEHAAPLGRDELRDGDCARDILISQFASTALSIHHLFDNDSFKNWLLVT